MWIVFGIVVFIFIVAIVVVWSLSDFMEGIKNHDGY